MGNYNLKSDSGDRNHNVVLGRQLIIEYYDCDPKKLLVQDSVEQAFLDAATQSGATIISSSFHTFNPHGISGVVIIAESHFTVHIWPEYSYAAVDIFTCSNSIDLEKAMKLLKEFFCSENMVISSDINRGVL